MLYQKIILELENNNIEQALELSQKELLKKDDDLDLLNIYALCLVKKKLFKQGIAVLNKAIKLDPRNPTLFVNLSNIYQAIGDLEQALTATKQALKLHSQYSEAFNQLGNIYYKQKQYVEAINNYKKAISINPNFMEARSNLGNTFALVDDYEASVAEYEFVLNYEPENFTIRLNLALAYMKLSKFPESNSAFSKIVHKINDSETLSKIAEVKAECGDINGAIEFYRKTLAIDEYRSRCWHNLAVLFLKTRSLDDAKNCFKKAVLQDPLNQSAKHMLSALEGTNTESAPVEYIQQLFDNYADRYNVHMLKELKYQVPLLLRELLAKDPILAKKSFLHGLDLGCGTGIASIYFRDPCVNLIGLDLSLNMLKHAKSLGSYDHCIYGDVKQLPFTPNTFDLVIAADVFVYFGKLDLVINNIARVMKQGGILLFNIEKSEYDELKLLTSGRYAHTVDYLLETLEEQGFSILHHQEAVIRKNNNADLIGELIMAKSN